MARFIGKRLLLMIPVLLGVAIVVFSIMYFVPGDPASLILGPGATQAEISELRHKMLLDRPYIEQLGGFLYNTFIKFDFGASYFSRLPVLGELMVRLPRTFMLSFSSIILMMLIGIPLGITSAVNQNKFSDRLCMFISLVGVSMPNFWLALLLVLIFSLGLGWLPATGIGGAQYYILPVLALMFGGLGELARLSRSSMLDVIRSDFVVTGRSKGLSEREVIFKHALPNALLPIITVLGTRLGQIFGGSVVIESVFSFPGVGTYMINAINNRDYPIVRGSILFLAAVFSLTMLLVDIAYGYVDPRIKAQYIARNKKGA